MAPDAFLGTNWEATWVTGPQATGGEREYGRRIAGTWGAESQRSLTLDADVVAAR